MFDRTNEMDERIEERLELEAPHLVRAVAALTDGAIADWRAFTELSLQFVDDRVRAWAMLAAVQGGHSHHQVISASFLHTTHALVRTALAGTLYEETADVALLRHYRDTRDPRMAASAAEMIDRWRGYGYFCACTMFAEHLLDEDDIDGAIELLRDSMIADEDPSLIMLGSSQTRIDVRLLERGVASSEVETFRAWIRSFSWNGKVN